MNSDFFEDGLQGSWQNLHVTELNDEIRITYYGLGYQLESTSKMLEIDSQNEPELLHQS
jgi:hypothetical protein